MKTLTLAQAIEIAPCIGATSPSSNVSLDYQFVSTQNILEKVLQQDWNITNVTSQNKRLHSQHRVTLVHNNFINDTSMETIPRIELFNSHDRTKRFMFAVGLFRLVCSNGLMVASGPSETVRTKHVKLKNTEVQSIEDQLAATVEKFPTILNIVKAFKDRELSYEEQQNFAEFAIKGRFLYRQSIPKRFKNIEEISSKFLTPKRVQDQGNCAWKVYNKVQENLIRGIEGFSRPITGYTDTIRVNELLWKGTEATLSFKGSKLKEELGKLLIKNNN